MGKKSFVAQKKAVAQYYDNNTRRFLRFGKNQNTYNIHQALWAEGIENQTEAVNFANRLILKEIEALNEKKQKTIHVLDLGCGVGGSLSYLAQKSLKNNCYSGLTISKVQAKLGQQIAEKLKDEYAISIKHGDFLELAEGPRVDLAYAIEAFVHAADAQHFFASVSGQLGEGGRLIIIDDFRTPQVAANRKEEQHLVDFQQGWHAASLISPARAKTLASHHQLQLIAKSDLTPYLEMGRPRDKAIGLMVSLFGKWMRKSTYFQSLTGGYAKQQCIRQGLVTYQMLIFEKSSS